MNGHKGNRKNLRGNFKKNTRHRAARPRYEDAETYFGEGCKTQAVNWWCAAGKKSKAAIRRCRELCQRELRGKERPVREEGFHIQLRDSVKISQKEDREPREGE